MVGGRWVALAVLVSAVCAACRKPATTANLCFSTRAGMGQNLQTLYCGKDSCYLMVFAPFIPRPAAVSLSGGPVSGDTLAIGDALVQSFLSKEMPSKSSRSSTSFSVERNGVEIALPRTPEAEGSLANLKNWVHNRKEELRLRAPLWKDSLILSKSENKPRETAIRLSSNPTGKTFFESPLSLKVINTPAQGSDPEMTPTRVDWPKDSVQPLLDGKFMTYNVPDGVDSLMVILKVYSPTDSTALPAACMEGVFELRSGTLGLK